MDKSEKHCEYVCRIGFLQQAVNAFRPAAIRNQQTVS